MEDAKQAVQALEKERNTWQKKFCRQDEKFAKLLDKAENEKREKMNKSASEKQLAMTNRINSLEAKVLMTDKPSNESVCLVGDEKLNHHTSVPKVILMIHNIFFLQFFIMPS